MSQSYGNPDNTWEMILAGILALAVLWAIYTFRPQWVMGPWKVIRQAEVAMLSLAPMSGKAKQDVLVIKDFLSRTPAREITTETVSRVNVRLWEITRIPYSILLFWLAFVQMRRRAPHARLNMEGLIKSEARIRSHLRFFLHHRPDKEPDLLKGKWAMFMKPEEFAEAHGIIKGSTFLAERAEEQYIRQLGPAFAGFDAMTTPQRWVCAMFVACIINRRDLMERLIDHCNDAHAGGLWQWLARLRANRIANQLLKTHAQHEVVQRAVDSHHYTTTLLMRLYQEAKETGVLTTNLMPWLRLQDRVLFIALHEQGATVGTAPVASEAAGIESHFRYEYILKRKFKSPQVEGAIKGLRETLVAYGQLPGAEEEESSEAQAA
jgi:hypothetical protein